MSPSSLRAMASNVDARVGIEFEMYVPGIEDEDDAPDDDGEVTSFEDIVEYYRREMRFPSDKLQQLSDVLQNDYTKWVERNKENLWSDHIGQATRRKAALGYMRKTKSFDFKGALEGVIDKLDDTDPERKQNLKKHAQVALTAFLDTSQVSVAMNVLNDLDDEERVIAQTIVKIVKKKIEDKMTELVAQVDLQPTLEESIKIREYASEKFADVLLRPEAWLSSTTQNNPNITNVKQYIERKYPQFIPVSQNRSSNSQITQVSTKEELAELLSGIVGMPVRYGDYHSGKYSDDCYRLEEDSSLSDGDQGAGVELITPNGGLSLSQMNDHLNKIVKWAKSYGVNTTDTTGLHINVSVPNMENLDYTKLVIFLGDQHVLNEFGRLGNTYCKSMMQTINNKTVTTNDCKAMARSLQNGMIQAASKEIHSGSTNKYVSVNNKGHYIEFRSPGGDWLNKDLSVLVNTINRFVVALDIACDPERYRNEYIKKLYSVIFKQYTATAPYGNDATPDGVVQDIAKFYARYIGNEAHVSDHDISNFRGELKRKLSYARGVRTSSHMPSRIDARDPNTTRGLGTGAPLSSIGKPKLNTNGEQE